MQCRSFNLSTCSPPYSPYYPINYWWYLYCWCDTLQTPTINSVTFSRAFQEWRNCQYEIANVKKEPLFTCPACDTSQHSVHIDGNKKLYRFSKVQRWYKFLIIKNLCILLYRGSHKSYYSNDFIVQNSSVDCHLEKLGYMNGEVWYACVLSFDMYNHCCYRILMDMVYVVPLDGRLQKQHLKPCRI